MEENMKLRDEIKILRETMKQFEHLDPAKDKMAVV
eukprot:CAMPEP_0204879022 /NCGR_PEP_ID=MMETSP1349-20130617/314_1 /ASSEMBLY_ACC=CAM_ASM_000710 /TAXON_ID=215587 /ORGANISM="Aplanochytrium stocchinoi, Strain GSBS06" /LENGTH=34 /DNA_ID= /DNA_START= /DNA_END= /DNA_ORIENTATION=